jgi:hypothetical protein
MASIAEINGLTIPASGAAFLLDQSYASGAAAAYSVRRLSSSTGALLRVRRVTGVGNTGNDDEADFSYDSNNELSLDSPISNADAGVNSTTLGSFLNVGTVNGVTYPDTDSLTNTAEAYSDTWYDQSGNSNDATQSTPGSQPQIHGGTVNTDLNTVNGKPLVGEVNVKRGQFLTPVDFSGDFTTFQVGKRTQPNHISFMFGSSPYWPYAGAGSSDSRIGSYTTTPVFYGDGSSMGTTRQDVYNLWVNQCLFVTHGALTANNLKLGFNGTSFSMPSMQELIVWNADKTSERADIESNINSYYTIY